eukprot:m.11667 g.11667  ORF g.11667 m.11667 type:complete len:54 (-) comp8915_c0_seq1:802-963(-)
MAGFNVDGSIVVIFIILHRGWIVVVNRWTGWHCSLCGLEEPLYNEVLNYVQNQ